MHVTVVDAGRGECALPGVLACCLLPRPPSQELATSVLCHAAAHVKCGPQARPCMRMHGAAAELVRKNAAAAEASLSVRRCVVGRLISPLLSALCCCQFPCHAHACACVQERAMRLRPSQRKPRPFAPMPLHQEQGPRELPGPKRE